MRRDPNKYFYGSKPFNAWCKLLEQKAENRWYRAKPMRAWNCENIILSLDKIDDIALKEQAIANFGATG
jgi:hypothetical protein